MLYQLASISFITSIVQCSCLHGTSHLQRRVTPNNTVEVSTFGYTGQKGPLLWQTLNAANIKCEQGTYQSPINIDASIKTAMDKPKITIANPGSFEFENLGTTVEVIANGTTEFGNKTFNLKQFHFHSPSEHRINEEHFPLEMHMVHEATDGSRKIMVLGILFDFSEQNTPLLAELSKEITEISAPGAITDSGPLNLDAIVKHLETEKLRTYSGSLTTPPCMEGITFAIAEKSLPVNAASFNAMKKVLKFNSRFTQGTLGEVNLIERALKSTNAIPQPLVNGVSPQPPNESVSTVNASTIDAPTNSPAAPATAATTFPATNGAKTEKCKKRKHGNGKGAESESCAGA